jgi:hypothetical protein
MLSGDKQQNTIDGIDLENECIFNIQMKNIVVNEIINTKTKRKRNG